MCDLPAHLDPERIPQPWKKRVPAVPVFSHPLAIAGYQAYPSVIEFAANVKEEIAECYRLDWGERVHGGDFGSAAEYRAVAAEYTRWAREEGLI